MKTRKFWWLVGAVVLIGSNVLTAWVAWRPRSEERKPDQAPSPTVAAAQPPSKPNEPEEVHRRFEVQQAQFEKDLQAEQDRLDLFEETLGKTDDPVALALPFANSSSPRLAAAGIAVLKDHWEDPRSEETLVEIARGPAQHLGDGLYTPGAQAQGALLRIQARKEKRELLKGATSRPDKAARIRNFFKEHPECADVGNCPREKALLVRELLITIEEEDDDYNVELMWLVKLWPVKYAEHQPAKALALLKRLGRAKTFAQPDPYMKLSRVFNALGNEKGFVELLRDWLKEATDDDEIDILVYRLMAQGQSQLLQLLKEEHRPKVVMRAAKWFRTQFVDQTSLQALRETKQRRAGEGASEDELRLLADVIEDVAKMIANK